MSAAAPGVHAPPRASFGAGRVVLIALGALIAAIGLGLVAGGGVIAWANETQRDDSGYFTTSTQRFATDSYALTHERVELFDTTADSDWEEELGDLATLRVRASGTKPIFLGIGPADAVERYLADVAHSDVDDLEYHPFRANYTDTPGEAPSGVPGHESFWAVTAGGASSETLTWPVEPGTWSLVVMNADGSRGVAANLEFGAKIEHLGWLALGLVLGGALLVAGGATMILRGGRKPPAVEARPDPDGPGRNEHVTIPPQEVTR
jgi:hypothetical protein